MFGDVKINKLNFRGLPRVAIAFQSQGVKAGFIV